MRRAIGGTMLATGATMLASPAAGQGVESTGLSDGPSFGPFIFIFVLMAVAAVVTSVVKFTRVKEMGMRRGMSERDATTAALFSDESTMAGMILRDEDDGGNPPSIEDRLEKIEELRSRGLITDDEASERRSEILDEI